MPIPVFSQANGDPNSSKLSALERPRRGAPEKQKLSFFKKKILKKNLKNLFSKKKKKRKKIEKKNWRVPRRILMPFVIAGVVATLFEF